MITDIIFGIVIALLVGLLLYEKHENKKERAKLIHALISKTPEQFRDLELTDKVKPITPPEKTEPDLIPESDLSDEEFKKVIAREVG